MPPWSPTARRRRARVGRSEEHTSELQSHLKLVCRLLLEKKKICVGFIVCLLRLTVARGSLHGERLGERLVQGGGRRLVIKCFFFNDTATTEIYTLSLHDALPIPRSSG